MEGPPPTKDRKNVCVFFFFFSHRERKGFFRFCPSFLKIGGGGEHGQSRGWGGGVIFEEDDDDGLRGGEFSFLHLCMWVWGGCEETGGGELGFLMRC